MGLDVYLMHNYAKVNYDSKKYPDHYFKIGYFRSAYHEYGLNSILENNGIPNLYQIFGLENLRRDKKIKPDFNLALNNVKDVISKFKEVSHPVSRSKSKGRFYLDPEDRDGCIEYLEIVQETIEYVLSQDNKEEFLMYWYP